MTSYEQFRESLERNPIAVPTATPNPHVGQVWRAVWDDAVSNVFIDAATQDTVAILPITGDPELVPRPRYFLDVDDSPLGYTAAVWRSPRIEAPLFVLDACYGEIPRIDEEPADSMTPLGERARIADPGWQIEKRLNETMLRFRDATWLPESQPVGPVRDLMRRAQVSARTLGERLPVTRDTIRLVLDSSWWITDDAVAILADTLAVPVADLPHGDPFASDPELPRAINSPSRKTAFELRAARDGVTEAQARFAAAHRLLPALTRQTGRDIDQRAKWDQLLDLYLSDG